MFFSLPRLKLLIDQEKTYQERKEEENNKKVTNLKDELTKLKSFALLNTATQAQEELSSAQTRLQEEENKVLRLEEELRNQACHFHQEQEAMTAKLTSEDVQNRQLRQKLSSLSRQLDELEETNKTLHRAEEELLELRDKISRGECGNSSLVSEVEELRKRVLEMEGKDEELIKMEDMCRDLNRKLEKESSQSCSLKAEVDKLNHRIMELEKLEDAFGKNVLRVRIKELEATEVHLEKMELALKEDLTKLKTLTVMLAEQDKVNTVTEKLIEESKRALRSKAELEEKMCIATRERDELKAKLKAEEEKNSDLQSKAKEEHTKSPVPYRYQQEDNKVKDLSQEVERLRRKLKEMKAERAKALMEELEVSRKELSKFQLAEKEESNQEHILYKRLKEEEAKSSHLTREVEALKEKIHEYMGTEESICRLNTDHTTLQRKLTQQEVRNKELAREMETLTRELERYRRFSKSLRPGMNGRRFSDLQVSTKEVQTDPTDSLSPNYKNLAPLERALVNGKLYVESDPEDEVNYNEINLTKCTPSHMNNVNNLNNNMRRVRGPFLKTRESQHPINGKMQPRQNGNHVQQGDVFLAHSPGQPLHIKVTPDHGHNMATLEITSPTTENAQSYTSTAVIPTSGAPPKQRITILQNSPISPSNQPKGSPPPPESPCSPSTPDRSMSPLSIAAYSQTLASESCGTVTPDRAMSPIQIVSVTTGSPDRLEPIELVGGHTVFRVSPERQNSWQLQRSNSSGPNVITTDDNKIHIHLGSPYIQAVNTTAKSIPYYSLGPEQRIPVLTSGTPAKGNNKITSSIVIKPTSSPISRPSQITMPLESFRRPGPTRIPKPKGYSAAKGSNSSVQTPLDSGK
ncbi:hypothetical protein cypCar_00037554 [Cyprinus carpio]|nr:hypothetical protein cypCar_00037554 [Cyprinus carpio]